MAGLQDVLDRVEAILRQTDAQILNNTVTQNVRHELEECLVNLERVKHLFSTEIFENVNAPLRQLSLALQHFDMVSTHEETRYEAERIKTGKKNKCNEDYIYSCCYI